jgi:hypothetical protein
MYVYLTSGLQDQVRRPRQVELAAQPHPMPLLPMHTLFPTRRFVVSILDSFSLIKAMHKEMKRRFRSPFRSSEQEPKNDSAAPDIRGTRNIVIDMVVIMKNKEEALE